MARKTLSLFSCTILFVSLLVLTSGNVHAKSSMQKKVAPSISGSLVVGSLTRSLIPVKPSASGGGCYEGISYPAGGLLDIKACISYVYTVTYQSVQPDNYLVFGYSAPYLWTSCTVTTYVYRNGYYIGYNSDGCFGTARANGDTHFGPYVYGYPRGDYSSQVCVRGTYDATPISTCQSSPHVRV